MTKKKRKTRTKELKGEAEQIKARDEFWAAVASVKKVDEDLEFEKMMPGGFVFVDPAWNELYLDWDIDADIAKLRARRISKLAPQSE
jgi:hypothetical protein